MEIVRLRCPNALIIPGFMPEIFNNPYIMHSPTKFRFVRIDVDHYLPTKGAIEFFLPRMVPGGIMQFDDYNHHECPGATKAIDEIIGAVNIKQPAHWINA